MTTQIFKLSHEQRDRLLQEVGNLLKERGVLQQSVREQQAKTTTANEELFLELLEVVDTLEFLLNYVANHEPSPQSWERLPKSLASIEKKLLMILERRQVNSIDFSATQPDFTLCRVVDREVRSDLENQTITKVVRRGFRLGNKLLRPIEVITSKTS
ncbi:MAG: nucleotide exchange factor GrpE [Nostocaceae cyanobacterium]|nr:nucleotide exchange factor GrpE [Nostocaceae cyanobacterium]